MPAYNKRVDGRQAKIGVAGLKNVRDGAARGEWREIVKEIGERSLEKRAIAPRAPFLDRARPARGGSAQCNV